MFIKSSYSNKSSIGVQFEFHVVILNTMMLVTEFLSTFQSRHYCFATDIDFNHSLILLTKANYLISTCSLIWPLGEVIIGFSIVALFN